MKITTYTSVVTYIKNNQDIIADFLLRLDGFLYQHFTEYEIILINDNSTDNTLEKIYEEKDKIKGNVMLVDLSVNHGIDIAMEAGTDIAIGDFIYEVEAISIDMPFEILLNIHKKATEEGYDIVFVNTDKRAKLPLRLYSTLMEALSKKRIEISNNPIRLVTRRALNSVAGIRSRDRYILFKESGFQYLSMTYYSSLENIDKDQSITGRLIKDVELLALYTNTLYKIPFVMSSFFGLMAVIIGLYNIYLGIIIGTFKHHNWLYELLLLGFSITFLILGIICKYLDMIVKAHGNKKYYKVRTLKRLGRE